MIDTEADATIHRDDRAKACNIVPQFLIGEGDAPHIKFERWAKHLPIAVKSNCTSFESDLHAEDCTDGDRVTRPVDIVLPLLAREDLASAAIEAPDILLEVQIGVYLEIFKAEAKNNAGLHFGDGCHFFDSILEIMAPFTTQLVVDSIG